MLTEGRDSFCGSTNDFCNVDAGCQKDFGGCGPPNRPSCGSGSSANKRTIGYYESWASTRKCQAVTPEDLNLNGFTHINFAFAFFDPKSFEIAPMDSSSGALYSRFTALKDTHRGLKTWISVGGWSFTDPGPTRDAFSVMSSTSSNRAKFIKGAMTFMDQYGFDGLDIDWEYPGADDRGGGTTDSSNFVTLVKEMRAAFGSKYGITVTLPLSFWYLQHFDLPGLQSNVDWFNLMSYDLHGTWDAQSKWVGPYVAAHTNMTEIDLGMDLLWRAGVKSDKVVLGLGWYGRSFTLQSSSCNTPNGICQFTGGAKAGPCSNAAGILDLQEIQNIVKEKAITPTWDKKAGVKWITWDSNQWVSYDDSDTFQQKRDFANQRCLAGTMVWAMDQLDQTADNGLAPAPGVTKVTQEEAQAMTNELASGLSCYASDCNADCMRGTNEVAQMNGQPGQVSTKDRCAKGQYRKLCCADGTTMGKCQWRGFRGAGMSCISGCEDGETEIVKDTNNHVKKKDQDCTGGLQSFCCKGFKTSPNTGSWGQKAEDVAKALAIAAAEELALDIAAKIFCRVAVPALLAPLEALEALIPFFGEIAILVEIAAIPALIQVCVKGIEKAGKAELKVFGKSHTINYDKPVAKPSVTRAPEKSHSTAKTSSSEFTSSCPATARDLGPRAGEPDAKRQCLRRRNVAPAMTRTTHMEDSIAASHTTAVTIDCAKYPQPCLHYHSMDRLNPASNYLTNTCWYVKPVDNRVDLPAKTDYDKQHDNKVWKQNFLALRGPKGCEADEWPPYALYHERDGYDQKVFINYPARPVRLINRPQWIRLLEGYQNGGVGNFWNCKNIAVRTDYGSSVWESVARGTTTPVTDYSVRYERSVYRIELQNLPNLPDDGLAANECYPRLNDGKDYRGYALHNQDPWYALNPNAPAPAIYKGALPKRSVESGDPDDIFAVVGVNATRKATDEELLENFGLLRCESDDCQEELVDYADQGAVPYRPRRNSPANAPVTATTVVPVDAQATVPPSTAPKSRVDSAAFARQTQAS
ncbi:family 18 glycosyl hydrolase [Podospora appendiculata]|uniref:chitinase n=1 Tax=Podospora appendiculata TaxID=314037 RepID=A0AAE0XGI3_9PEZI|nr:family 18 glycosyl hydrolase [Podospora appendiculata]